MQDPSEFQPCKVRPRPPPPPLSGPTLHDLWAEHRAQRAVHVVLQREDVPAAVPLKHLAGRQPHVHAAQDLGVLAGGAGAQRRVQVALRGREGRRRAGV